MKNDGYEFDSGMGYGGIYREETTEDKKLPMLDNVIGLLRALIGILDIISENFGKRK